MARSTLTWGVLTLLGAFAVQAAVGTASANATSPIRHVVYVADDQGQQGGLVDNLNQVINVNGLPLYTDQFLWSTLFETTDHQGQYNFQVKGQQLAARVLRMRQSCPQIKIYLAGFGAGTTVILKAAECLPPNTVTRIILLAPSVSQYYDLRLALLSSVEGIDSYSSDADLLLRCETKKFGTTDSGKKNGVPAAGTVGFYPRVGSTTDAQIYTRLRQHFPTEYSDYSHGGHYGYIHLNFLQTQIIPLFKTAMISPCPTCSQRAQIPYPLRRATPPPPAAQRRIQPAAPPMQAPPIRDAYVPQSIPVPRLSEPTPLSSTTPGSTRIDHFPMLPAPNSTR